MSHTTQIHAAIKQRDLKTARELLKRELRANPTAELYYLASQVVTGEEQKHQLLEKALRLDPNHIEADVAFYELTNPATTNNPFDNSFTTNRKPAYATANNRRVAAQAVKRGRSFSSIDDFHAEKRRNVAHRYPKAGFFARLTALFIDGFILNIIGFIAGFAFGLVFPPPVVSEFNTIAAYETASFRWQVFAIVVSLLISVLYYIYFLTNNDGQTPGKSAMNIQIVKLDGTSLTIGDALLRNVVGYTLSGMFFLLGYIWALFDGQNQAWHDKIAKTVVVRT